MFIFHRWVHDAIDSWLLGPELSSERSRTGSADTVDVSGAWIVVDLQVGVNWVHEYGVADDAGITGLLDSLPPEPLLHLDTPINVVTAIIIPSV